MGDGGPGPGADLWVVGNALTDLMMQDVPSLPGWGEEVLAGKRLEETGGQGANLARAAARLELVTELMTVVGDDAAGARIRATIESEGIGTAALRVVRGRTALAVAVVRPDGERAFITDLGCSGALTAAELDTHEREIHAARAVALVGTANLPGLDLPAVASRLERARARGVLTVFDPGWGEDVAAGRGLEAVLAATDVFLPNLDEGVALTGTRELAGMLRALEARCAGTVIVTLGEDGSATLEGEHVVVAEPLPVEVDNAVGAGDVYAAGVVSALLDGADAVAAMTRGTAAVAGYLARSEGRYEGIRGWRARAAAVGIRRL